MKVQYYSSESNLPSYVIHQWKGQDIEWMPWRPGEPFLAEHFVLFSPIWHHEEILSCDTSWKKYFAAEKKDIRLLTIGVEDIIHPNYLYVFDLPGEASSAFKEIRHCGEENWTPAFTGGRDMNQMLNRFLNGHGSASLSQELTKVLGFMRIIEEDQQKKIPYTDTLKGLKIPEFLPELWQSFLLRWQPHYPYFGCLPYLGIFEEMNSIIQYIDIFFQTNCQDVNLFVERQCKQNIERLHELITQCYRYAD